MFYLIALEINSKCVVKKVTFYFMAVFFKDLLTNLVSPNSVGKTTCLLLQTYFRVTSKNSFRFQSS